MLRKSIANLDLLGIYWQATTCSQLTLANSAKRYERMMKAHQIGVDPPNNGEASVPALKEEATAPKGRKRKLNSEGTEKAAKSARRKPKQEAEEMQTVDVKKENLGDSDGYHASEWQASQAPDFGPFHDYVNPADLHIQGNVDQAATGYSMAESSPEFAVVNEGYLSNAGDLIPATQLSDETVETAALQ